MTSLDLNSIDVSITGQSFAVRDVGDQTLTSASRRLCQFNGAVEGRSSTGGAHKHRTACATLSGGYTEPNL